MNSEIPDRIDGFNARSRHTKLPSTSDKALSLLQIILNGRRLLRQELHVFGRIQEEISNRFERLVKRFGELSLFLVAPRGLQAVKLAAKRPHQSLQFIVKAF